MPGSRAGRRSLGALICTGLVLGVQVAALGAAVPAAATVPGSPGLPQAPTTVYAEGFENGTGQTPILLTAYTGAPPINAKYTAAPAWVDPAHCNGIILNSSGANQAACQAQNPVAMAALKNMANVLGQVAGVPAPASNHAVSAYTDGANPGANKVEFQTVNPIPLVTSNRFIAFSVDAVAENCSSSAPLLNFFLTGSGPDIPVTNAPINPCTDPRSQTFTIGSRVFKAGSFASDDSALFTGSAVGIKMTNANGSGLGNDHAYDNVKILDVTPQLDKEFLPASIPQGGTSTLTFTVTNTTDLAEKSGFGFTDALPAGVTVAAAPNASTTCGTGTVAATAGGSSVGLSGGVLTEGTAFCTVTVDVTSATVGDHVNQPGDVVPTGVNPPGPATLTVVVPGSPTIVKSADAATFENGQTIDYTYTVTNTASDPLTNLVVTDDGPGTPTVTCAATTLPAGASTTCTASYTATTTDALNGTITNSATVTGTVNAQTVSSTSNEIVIPLRSLTVTKAAEQVNFSAAGQTIDYTYTVTNNGRVPLTNISVTDNGPGTPTVTCPVGPLAPGDSEDCTASYTTTGTDVTNGNVTNSAVATGTAPDGEMTDDQSNTVIVPFVPPVEVDLAITKNGPATVAAGGTVTYSITVTNDGPGDSTGYTVTDAIPDGLTGATTSTPGCGIASGILTCTGTSLSDGASTTITFTGTASPGTASIVNTVTVEGNDPDPNPDNNTDTATTTVNRSVDLAITKTGPATVTAGGAISYTITLTNNGPSDSTGYTVTDPIPAGLTGAATTTPGCTVTGGTLTCTGASLADGASTTITLTGNASPGATSIVNTVTVAGNDPDPDPGNNTDTTTTTVTRSADLAVTKTGPATVAAGGAISYTITVTNNGPSDSTGYTVTDPIPAGLTGAATTTPGCAIASGTLTCTGASLAEGASTTITLTGNASPGATSVVNTVTVEGNDPDPDPGNNTDTTTTTVTGTVEADLAIVKTGPATVSPGGTLTYQLRVTNNGPDDSTGYTVTDTIPATVTGATTSTPGCSIGGGVLTCVGNALADGASTTITVTGTVAQGATSITNTATVEGDDPDPDPGNNTSTTTTSVSSVTIVKKQNGPSTVRPGDEVPYTITVRNNGGAPVGASFTDDLSGLLDDAAYNGDATADIGDVSFESPDLEWSGTLEPGQTATITFSVTVNRRPFGDLRLNNTVVSDTPGNNCPQDSTDSRCTTRGKVDVKDKDKDRRSAQPVDPARERAGSLRQNAPAAIGGGVEHI